MRNLILCVLAIIAATISAGTLGCSPAVPAGDIDVPEPIDLMLPRKVRIDPFSDVRRAAVQADGGVDVLIEATDSFGDATKAFGTFRFELYAFRANNTDPKGRLLTTWEVPVIDPKTNIVHWDGISRKYRFRLKWGKDIAAGQPFVLAVVFSSPFTQRLMDEHKFDGK